MADAATIPLLLTLIGLFGLVVMPLNNGLSRAIEYQADEYALQSTHMIEPFKSAMTRLANQNLADLDRCVTEWSGMAPADKPVDIN